MDKIEDVTVKWECDDVHNESTEKKIISKRQLKKQKKTEMYQLKKAERRKHERLKRKAKRAEKVARNEDLGPSKKRLKSNTMENSACKVRVAVDCSFDQLMTDRDIKKLCQQLQYCYAKNRRAPNPVQLYMTSVEGKTNCRLEEIGFFHSWDVHMRTEPFSEVFPQRDILYLSSDSSNVLETLRDDKVYVIGGLVDHNHHKGLCHRLAEERGIEHVQLPIGQFLHLSQRNVLTVNHVFEILLNFTETKSWKKAFFSAIPKRKIATNVEVNDDDDDDDDGNKEGADDEDNGGDDEDNGGDDEDSGGDDINVENDNDNIIVFNDGINDKRDNDDK